MKATSTLVVLTTLISLPAYAFEFYNPEKIASKFESCRQAKIVLEDTAPKAKRLISLMHEQESYRTESNEKLFQKLNSQSVSALNYILLCDCNHEEGEISRLERKYNAQVGCRR